MEGTLTTSEVAARLGVKVDTVYAYVSRGVLRRHVGEDGHSRFDPLDVERLALRGRSSGRRPVEPVVVASSITSFTESTFSYRGHDVADLCTTSRYEAVAGLLWGVDENDGDDGNGDDGNEVNRTGAPWPSAHPALEVARSVQGSLPDSTRPFDRLRVVVSALGAMDELRYDMTPAAVADLARGLIATMVDALPPPPTDVGLTRAAGGGHDDAGDPDDADPMTDGRHESTSIAARLARRLLPRASTPAKEHVALVDTALVLTADQGLTPSTIAARAAASVQADPYSVIVAGLGAIAGRLHGAACLGAEELLDDVARKGGGASGVIGARLRRGERIPGFGQPNYPAGDPRATILLTDLERLDKLGPSASTDHIEAVLETMRSRSLPPPNVDFGLAAVAHALGMVPGASEGLIAIGRCAGWIAHALEEYRHPSRFRLEAISLT